MNDWLQAAFLGAAVVAVLFPVLLFSLRRRPDPLAVDEDAPPELLFGASTDAVADQIPMGPDDRRDVVQLLRAAGYYQRSAIVEYRALRTLLTLIPLLTAGALALAVPDALTTRVLLGGALFAALGFSLPRVVVGLQANSRSRQVARSLPLAIDLLTLCLSGGQSLLAALRQVATELQHSHPVIAQELAIAHRQAELHSLEVAMTEWAERSRIPEVNSLALLLIQSEKLGTDTAATLVELAANFRSTSRQRAETQANRASFWMLFPSIFCFWVAAAIVLTGPAYLEYFGYRERNGQLFNQTRRNLERANTQDRTIRPRTPANGTPADPPTRPNPQPALTP